jgi:hypothetical protein
MVPSKIYRVDGTFAFLAKLGLTVSAATMLSGRNILLVLYVYKLLYMIESGLRERHLLD